MYLTRPKEPGSQPGKLDPIKVFAPFTLPSPDTEFLRTKITKVGFGRSLGKYSTMEASKKKG